MFNLLFAKEALGMSVDQFGKIMSVNAVISFFVLMPMGILVDKFHPLRTYMAGGILIVAANIFGFFFVRDYTSFYIVSVMLALVYVIQNASKLPMFVALLPTAQYGQFSSANAMVVSIFLILANAGGGAFVDLLGYQYIYVWDFLFTGLGLFALFVLYRGWKKRGGRESYRPPLAGEAA